MRLWRILPPFTRRVEVRRITVRGWLTLVRAVAVKVATARVEAGRDLTDADVIAQMGDGEEVALFADLVSVNQPTGYLHGWLGGYLMSRVTRRNIHSLLAASRKTEGDGGWTRILSTLNLAPPATGANAPAGSPPRRRSGGGLMADVVTVSRLTGDAVQQVLDMDMQTFLLICESLNLMASQEAAQADATLDPQAEPMPLAAFVVH